MSDAETKLIELRPGDLIITRMSLRLVVAMSQRIDRKNWVYITFLIRRTNDNMSTVNEGLFRVTFPWNMCLADYYGQDCRLLRGQTPVSGATTHTKVVELNHGYSKVHNRTGSHDP